MEERFSKDKVRAILLHLIEENERKHGFKQSLGTCQVDGKGEAVNRAYGEYEAAQFLWDSLRLG